MYATVYKKPTIPFIINKCLILSHESLYQAFPNHKSFLFFVLGGNLHFMCSINTVDFPSMKHVSFYLISLFVFQACVTQPEERLLEPTLEDMAVINEIGQSLGVESDGIVSSIYDATASLSQGGINMSSSSKVPENGGNHGRGNDTDIQVRVNLTTGVHTVSLKRELSTPKVSKSLTALFAYLYKKDNGDFIIFPRFQAPEVAQIQFLGIKTGLTTHPKGRTGFLRVDSLHFEGMGRNSGSITVRGELHSKGFFEFTEPDQDIFRFYAADYKLADVQIKRLSVQERDLSKALSGSIEYNFLSKKVVGTDTLTNTYSGRIEFTGDGNAIIRSRTFKNPFWVDLKSGQIKERRGKQNGKS